jgi:ABC-type branched-subunit amino acid transport system ATPase component
MPTLTTKNPFTASRIRPGAIPFLFANGDEDQPRSIVDRLRQYNWRGQIIGPHGSGKSTLIESLIASLNDAGRSLARFALHADQRRLPVGWRGQLGKNGCTQVIIDGFEQLHFLQRWLVRAACRLSRNGLLVTAHKSVGLPTIHQTFSSFAIVERVLENLWSDYRQHFDCGAIRQSYQRHQGNTREVLFDMYDLYESLRS